MKRLSVTVVLRAKLREFAKPEPDNMVGGMVAMTLIGREWALSRLWATGIKYIQIAGFRHRRRYPLILK
jgi:hypothetical protein